MARVQHSIQINRPIDEVFAYVTDPDKLKDWNGDLVESHGDKPPRVGAKVTQVRTILGQKVEGASEVTVWDPPHSMTLKSIGGNVDVAGTISCQEMGGGTEVTLSFDLVPMGVLKIAEGAFASQAGKSMERDLGTLKQMLEG